MATDLKQLRSLVGAEIYGLLCFWSSGVHYSLRDNLVGTYLTGSLTYGDFVETRSDIDLAVVAHKPLSETELESIKLLHLAIESQFPKWHQRIECSYIPEQLLSCVLPPEEPRPWWGFGVLYEAAPYGNEWIINQYFLWKCSIPIAGPEFRSLVQPVQIGDVQNACIRDLIQEWVPKSEDPAWLDNPHYQSYLVLNLCRIIYTVLNSDAGSKATAASWVKNAYPAWAKLIESALGWQWGESMHHKQESIDFINFAVDLIGEMQDSSLAP